MLRCNHTAAAAPAGAMSEHAKGEVHLIMAIRVALPLNPPPILKAKPGGPGQLEVVRLEPSTSGQADRTRLVAALAAPLAKINEMAASANCSPRRLRSQIARRRAAAPPP